jgi:Uma2 family endonuclease
MATTVAPQIFESLFSDDASERFELIDGELRAKPMVSIFHSAMMTWLGHLLFKRLKN